MTESKMVQGLLIATCIALLVALIISAVDITHTPAVTAGSRPAAAAPAATPEAPAAPAAAPAAPAEPAAPAAQPAG